MKRLRRFIPYLKDKYVIVILFTVVWMIFFDRHDIISQFQARMKLKEMRKDKEYFRQKIDEVKKERDELMQNPQTMEKFAREKYFMKKDNEDIFILDKKK